MIDTCICYATDRGYLFPSLVSAMQARQHASKAKSDIFIVGVELDGRTVDLFRRICDSEGIHFLPVPKSSIGSTPAAMGRLFLADLLPAQYSQLLYLDGDTQIVGSLDPLLEANLPAGKFLAADDPIMFEFESGVYSYPQHFQSVYRGEKPTYRYFNSGVLRADRTTWSSIAARALALYETEYGTERGRLWRFADQDALNIVGGSSRIPLSLAWNFPIYLRDAGLHLAIKPSIYHFMASPKPWQGSFRPWNAKLFLPYLEAIHRYPELADYRTALSGTNHLRYRVQQRVKQVSTLYWWKYSGRCQLILDYEQSLRAGAPASRGQIASWPVNPAKLEALANAGPEIG